MSEAPKHTRKADHPPALSYGMECSVTDYILGITYEIWEEGQVEKILDYYGEDVVVYGLDGITRGAAAMVEQTHATLAAFPDRLLLGDDVIWTGTVAHGFSSHRVLSPMTNLGDTVFGPATGRPVRTMNVADCEINKGLISREWLVRDNLSLVRQLGFDEVDAARGMASRAGNDLTEWLAQEFSRVSRDGSGHGGAHPLSEAGDDHHFALAVLTDCWISGDTRRLKSVYAPYCVLHRAPLRIFSGREDTLGHYQKWRGVLPDARITVDHVCSQPFGAGGRHIAVRWGVAGHQQASIGGCAGHGQPLFILGVTHWRVLDGRIISEWTVFDELAVMAQSLGANG